jgi:hypothetical protein
MHRFLAEDGFSAGNAVRSETLVTFGRKKGAKQASGRIVVIDYEDLEVSISFIA